MTTPVITESHRAEVGGMTVRRALPRRERRTVGAWCFVDHMGPAPVPPQGRFDVGPHPHIGLQTVTWLLEGEALHRDSLGTEQLIRPGQLNLMTAGHGIAHAEEGLGARTTRVHGIQLWVAQPEATRHGAPAFEHHAELPRAELPGAEVTVLVGELAGVASPARRDTDHVGVDVQLRAGRATLPVQASAEHAVVVAEGRVRVGGTVVEPGNLAYLAPGLDEVDLASDEGARLLLVGGVPFESPITMWWNFVARTHEEVDAAVAAWNGESDRFGDPHSTLARIPAPTPPW